MTNIIMQSTFLTKEDYNLKNESEISEHKLKKLKFLLSKSKDSEIFEKEFLELENLPLEKRIINQWNLIYSFTRKLIEDAKNSPI